MCQAADEPFSPKRLLDLGSSKDKGDLELVYSRDSPSVRPVYVTLSHCWGPPSELSVKTTLSNLEERTENIPLASLPLTFQDAVQITRSLEVRYLWIDSLCIIQDSLKDKEEEVAIMGQVYARSLITLTASMSMSSDGGCRVEKYSDADDNPPLDILKGSNRIRIFEQSPLDWNAAWNRGPLRKRAWTLQERHLSMRSLHFSKTVLLWECKTSKASSELPWMQMRTEDPPPILMLNSAVEETVKFGSLAMREHWFDIVEDYSQRSLTYEADKLAALSGLAQFSSQLHGAYFAGLFQMDMPSALLWRSQIARYPNEIQPERPRHYRAPTWSWAAVEGVITYDSQKLSCTAIDQNPGFQEHDFGKFKILDVYVGSDTFGAVSHGSILVAGRLTATTVVMIASKENKMTSSDDYRLMLDRSGEGVGIVYPDVLSELQDGKDIICLEVRKERSLSIGSSTYHQLDNYSIRPEDEGGPKARVMGLALVKDHEHADGYKRIGLMRWTRISCFSDLPACEITIY